MKILIVCETTFTIMQGFGCIVHNELDYELFVFFLNLVLVFKFIILMKLSSFLILHYFYKHILFIVSFMF